MHATTAVDAMLDKGVAVGQAVGSVAAAPQYDPDGHTTGYDAFTGQYKPVAETQTQLQDGTNGMKATNSRKNVLRRGN
jgi:hypothetical protein